MPAVFFYISGHGFGHAVRQIEIINTLIAAAPAGPRVVIRTTAPRWLFERTVRGRSELLEGEVDTGVVQIDSLRLDEAATIERARDFYNTLPRRIDAEVELLRRHDAALVIADMPPLAFAAAARAGVPSFGCGNFTWDWIYRDYAGAAPEAAAIADLVRACHQQATGAWRLPMHGGFDGFASIVDVPFVARHARPDRTVARIREALALPRDRRLALVSFGGYGVRDLPLDRLDCLNTWDLVMTSREETASPRAGVHVVGEDRLYGEELRYEDLVRAVDVVVTKPGYGIISDCVGNHTPMLYTSRGRFAEYDVLVRELPKVLRCRYIELEDFLAGRWLNALNALSDAPDPPDRPRTDGARVVAGEVLQFLERRRPAT